ncbi:unnamed protein product [Amaranthus hypochondriacus]
MGKPRQPLEVDEHGFRLVKKSFRPKVVPKAPMTDPPEHDTQAMATHPAPRGTDNVVSWVPAKVGTLVENQLDKTDSYLHTDNSFAVLNLATEPVFGS